MEVSGSTSYPGRFTHGERDYTFTTFCIIIIIIIIIIVTNDIITDSFV